MVVDSLPPFRDPHLLVFGDRVCLKCGFSEAGIQYCDAPGCLLWASGEHLHRTCSRCGYTWVEATLDRDVTQRLE